MNDVSHQTRGGQTRASGTGMAAEKSFVAVDCGRRGEVAAYVTFPAPVCVAGLAFARNLQFALLLKLGNGAVWFLRCPRPWIEERIQSAARSLATGSAHGLVRTELEIRLAYALEVPTLDVADAPLAETDADAWGARRASTAALLKAAREAPSCDVALAMCAATEQAMREQLQHATCDFVAGLDAEALGFARTETRFDAQVYNYLVNERNSRYRRQFARTFPLLVRAAATAYPGGEAFGLCSAVDGGAPIIRYLTRSHGVSVSTVRSLSGVTPAVAGTRWQERYGALLRVLDALCPEDRPGGDFQAWAHFNAAVEMAERRFRRKSHTSPLALAWLRSVAKGGWADLRNSGKDVTEPSAIAAVDRLREAVLWVLGEQAGKGSHDAIDTVVRLTQVVDRHLLGYGSHRLVDLARACDATVARAHAVQWAKLRILEGDFYWPFLPAPRTCSRRMVRCLESREALRRHGEALGICIGSTHLDTYAISCLRGESFLVGLYDTVSGEPQSTARFHLIRNLRDGCFRPELVEFAGYENQPASEDCRSALRELIEAASEPELQRHWGEGMRILKEAHALGRNEAKERTERLILEEGLRATLGAAYERLLAEARRVLEKTEDVT